MNGRIWFRLAVIPAAALFALAASGAHAGPRTYDLNAFFGPDPFAAQFWGQAPVSPGAPAPGALAPALPPAAAAIPVRPIIPGPAPVPVQILPPAPAAVAEAPDAGLRPIPPLFPDAPPQAVPVPASAPSVGFLPSISGRYMVGRLGIVAIADASNRGAAVNHKTAYKSGLAVQLALGYEWSPNWNLEAEFAVRRATADTITPANGTAVAATGSLLTMSMMANGVRGLDFGWPLTPYVMLGGGFARVQARDIVAAGVSNTNSSDWALAYQFGGGFDYPLSQNWSVDFSYRYFATTKPEFANAAAAKYESELASHDFLVGTRYRF